MKNFTRTKKGLWTDSQEGCSLCDAGHMHPILNNMSFELSHAAQAYNLLESELVTGKIVVKWRLSLTSRSK